MLKNTFLHIPGIGPKTERRLWSSGVLAWDDYFKERALPLSDEKRLLISKYLKRSQRAVDTNTPSYFEGLLPCDQSWRLFPDFRDSVAYLDIETTGLDNFSSYITTIALYDGKSISYYVHAENLEDFKKDIQKYKVIVTYNGRCFDVPFIRNSLGAEMPHVHIDLRWILAGLGYRGGLKGCEKQLGLERGELDEVDGYFAVLLWNDFEKNKNQKALETLLAYNIADVVNLETLMVLSYNLKLNETPFSESHRLPSPARPEIPFAADTKTIERIRYEYFY